MLVHGSHTVLCLPTSGRPPRRFRLREDRCCQTLADTFLASGADQLALAMQPTDKVFMLQLPPNSSRLCCGCKEAAGVSALLGELVGEEDAARVARPADLAVACAVACAAALAKDCTAAFRDHDRWASIHHRLPKAIRRRLMYMRQHEHTVVPMVGRQAGWHQCQQVRERKLCSWPQLLTTALLCAPTMCLSADVRICKAHNSGSTIQAASRPWRGAWEAGWVADEVELVPGTQAEKPWRRLGSIVEWPE